MERVESEIHCNCTDAEIAKSFIEDVETVKELLQRSESEAQTHQHAQDPDEEAFRSDQSLL